MTQTKELGRPHELTLSTLTGYQAQQTKEHGRLHKLTFLTDRQTLIVCCGNFSSRLSCFFTNLALEKTSRITLTDEVGGTLAEDQMLHNSL